MTTAQIITAIIAWTGAAVSVAALIATRRQAARNQHDRDLARLAHTYDLYIQDAKGNRRIQMTFAEILAGSVEEGDHTLTLGVEVIRRKPGVRVFSGQGVGEFERPAPRLSDEEYAEIRARWQKLHDNQTEEQP